VHSFYSCIKSGDELSKLRIEDLLSMGVSVCCANRLMIRIKRMCSGLTPLPLFNNVIEKPSEKCLAEIIPSEVVNASNSGIGFFQSFDTYL
jgi:hypothetical protein